MTKESNASARDYFERAIKIDPQNAEAMVGLAYARIRAASTAGARRPTDTPAAQMELLTKATAINPGYAFAYYVKSRVFCRKQFPKPFEAAQTAVTLDPNAAYGYYAMGLAEIALGRCEQSIATYQTGVRPKPPRSVAASGTLSWAMPRLCLVRLDAAIEEFKQAIDAGYRDLSSLRLFGGSRGCEGQRCRGEIALAEARRINPQLTIKWFGEHSGPDLPPVSLMACARLGCRRNEFGALKPPARRATPWPPSDRACRSLR